MYNHRSNDGAQYGPNHKKCTRARHGETTLLGSPDVGEGSTQDRRWRRTENSLEKATEEDEAEGLQASCKGLKQPKESVGHQKWSYSTVSLGKWPSKHFQLPENSCVCLLLPIATTYPNIMGPIANPSMKSDVPPKTAVSTATPYSCEIAFAATLNTADENVVVKTSSAKVIVMSHFRQMGKFCGFPLSPGPCHSTRNSSLCNDVTMSSISGFSVSTDITVVVFFEDCSGAMVAIVFGACWWFGYGCKRFVV